LFLAGASGCESLSKGCGAGLGEFLSGWCNREATSLVSGAVTSRSGYVPKGIAASNQEAA